MPARNFRDCLLACALALSAACQPAREARPESGVSPGADAALTAEELSRATYAGVREQSITLAGGVWEGQPFADGSAARPQVGLVRDFRLDGELDGKGGGEAAVLLWRSEGGSGTLDYLAVVGRDAAGAPVNLGTAALGDRVQLRRGAIADGQITLETVEAGPEDARCCPGLKRERRFALQDGALLETSSRDLGRLSLADLQGQEWVLGHFDMDEPLAAGVEITLQFEDGRIAGHSGCNRYSGGVAGGGSPGELRVSTPLATTRMACPPPLDAIEARFLEALQRASKFSFLAGKLALTVQRDERIETLLFTPRG